MIGGSVSNEKKVMNEEDCSDALNRFCCYHIDDLSNYNANNDMDKETEQKINLLPDKMDWIPKKFKAGWMFDPNFSFQIVFDLRSKE